MVVYMLCSRQSCLISLFDLLSQNLCQEFRCCLHSHDTESRRTLWINITFLSSYAVYLVSLRVPEVISLPITGGNLQYLEWIKNNTRDWIGLSSRCWWSYLSICCKSQLSPFGLYVLWMESEWVCVSLYVGVCCRLE